MSAPPALKPGEAAQLEQRALAFLAEGKFRKAREEAKSLRKLDAARGLPLLVRANVGLARDLMAKGQVSEAQQVLAYLATIASPAEIRALQTELAGHTGDFAAAAGDALRLLATSSGSLADPERSRAADLLIVAFQEPSAADPTTGALAAEVKAIYAAFWALAERQWAAAQDALRPIPQRSAFSHWKLFIKGLLAFYQGERDRARRCLTELPPETVPARAAEPYRLILATESGLASGQLPSPAAVAGLCHLLAQPGLAERLEHAELLWRREKTSDSFRAFREGLRGFPSEEPGLLGTLTDFYFNALFSAPNPMREELARCFDRVLARPERGNSLEQALMFRALGLYQAAGADAYGLHLDWGGFLEAYERVHGPNPRLASLALAFLGKQLSQPSRSLAFPLFRRQSQMLDPAGAVNALERSVALDPQNLEAALLLCDLYEDLRRTTEYHRLLDAMVGQFPEHKGVLLRAGRRCVDRKAFTKGLGYLTRARQLDVLDPVVARESLRALFGLAEEHFKKGRLEAARAALDQTLTFAVGQPTNLVCARWCLLTRRAATEEALGDAKLVESLLAEAQALCPTRAALLLYAHLALLSSQRARYDQATRFSEEFGRTQLKAASAASALMLLRIHEFWASSDGDKQSVSLGIQVVRRYLEAAQNAPFTDEEARQLAERAGAESPFYDETRGFVRRVLRRDRKHPWFRLYLLTSQAFGLQGYPEEVKELRSIIEEASRRGDAETAQRAGRLLKEPVPSPPPWPPPPPEAWEDEPADQATGRLGPPMGSPAPDEDEYFDTTDERSVEELVRQIALLPEGQRRRLRKQMMKKGLPGFLFDVLADAARQGGPPPTLPPVPKPGPRRTTAPDPNQLDLF